MARAHRGSTGGSWVAVAIVWLGCLSALSCQGPLIQTELGYEHQDIGYVIAMPTLPNAARWARISGEGFDLAFKRNTGSGVSTLTLMSDCGGTAAGPQQLARNIRLGLGRVELDRSMPIVHGVHAGWLQSFRTQLDGVRVYLKTVTVQVGICTFDWVLVTPDDPAALEAAFDAWWQTFEPGDRVEATVERP